MRQRVIHDLFLTYGSGAKYLERITRAEAWNLVSWVLIVAGAFGWVAFLFWKPQ